MARFIGFLRGGRGEVSRLGTPSSGIVATAQGWDIGGEVTIHDANGVDIVEFTLTRGSRKAGSPVTIARFMLTPEGPKEIK